MHALATLRGVAGGRVLDVGIGPGAYFSEIVRAAGPAAVVCGVDLSREMVRETQRRLRRDRTGNARVIGGDALTLPFGDESFDTLVSSYLLDLMPLEAIACAQGEFLRVLKPSGRAVSPSEIVVARKPGMASAI
jgi:ubiquinone/menaquinone biosynthesis C-methylase UbiE